MASQPSLRGRAAALILALLVSAASAQAQPGPGDAASVSPGPGPAFVYGGLLVTSLHNDTQDPGRGYLHYNFIGELDWPATGVWFGGGGFVTRHLMVAGELALRREMATTVLVQSGGHTDRLDLSGLYTSHERLVSLACGYDAAPGGPVSIRPLGGLTISRATRALTDQRGFSLYPGIPPHPITNADVSVSEWKPGLLMGADLTVRAGGSVAILVAPRLHWIDRDRATEYEHVVPNAAPLITSISLGVQWRPRARR